MTGEQLAAIEARCAAATPGPWHGVQGRLNAYVTSHDERLQARIQGLHPEDGTPTNAVADTLFIAHARTDLPALVADYRRLRAALVNASIPLEVIRATEWNKEPSWLCDGVRTEVDSAVLGIREALK